MAYNNGFPTAYGPAYYPQANMQAQTGMVTPPITQSAPQVNQNSSIIWVQGEAGAKSYLVAPNTTVQLWDSEEQIIYLKSADASGMPSIKILDYTIRGGNDNKPKILDDDNYATKSDIEDLQNQLEEIKKSIHRRRAKKEVEEYDE